ncbi:MAG: homoserine dehydrogenase [Gammaproteobacteria bacterium]
MAAAEKPVKVGLLGLGTVGGGALGVLQRNAGEISRRAGRGIEVTHVAAKEVKPSPRFSTAGIRMTSDPRAVVNDPEVEIVCELMGGLDPACDLILAAIANGKHVVTANKYLLAVRGNEIFKAARDAGVTVAFEAAVAGGIPVIKTVREALAGNRVQWLAGIINGTSNFILTAMREQGREFDAALAEAQRLGYAEADPSFDIDGHDASHKLTILAAIAFGIPLQHGRVHVEGIRGIAREDVTYAEELGYRIKHLGMARQGAGGVELRVHPTLVPRRRLIANVDGVMNAVLINGDAVGPVLLYGAGAGAEPTGSAVVADLVDVVRALTSDPGNRVPHLAFQPDALADLPILPMADVRTAYYMRLHAADRPGVLADITRILADRDISIEAILQKEPAEGAAGVPIVMLTHQVQERCIDDAIARIESLDAVSGRVVRIRREELA